MITTDLEYLGRPLDAADDASLTEIRAVEPNRENPSGGGGIRTRGRVAPSPVFKTGAFDRSATPPGRSMLGVGPRLARERRDDAEADEDASAEALEPPARGGGPAHAVARARCE
jgi:hypothetical protein